MAQTQIEVAVSRIKTAGHDISDEYPKERCIEFLNTAIQQTAAYLIAANYPPLVQEELIRTGDTIPKNYMKPCGNYPIKMTNGQAIIIDENVSSIKFRYFATPEEITTESLNMPFKHTGINDVVIRLATMLALNENEYDLTQDKVLLDTLQQAISSGMS